MPSDIEITDESRVKSLLNDLDRLKGKSIVVGVFGEKDEKLFIKASVNEYGASIDVTEKMRNFLHYKGLHLRTSTKTIEIPERSFLRSTFDENLNDIKKDIMNGVADVIAGRRSPRDLLNKMGRDLERAVKNKIRNIKKPPNHPFTIEQKSTTSGKGDKPLQDTGQLLRSITYEIR